MRVGVHVGEGDQVGLGEVVGVRVGEAVGVGEGVRVAVALGEAVGLGVRLGVVDGVRLRAMVGAACVVGDAVVVVALGVGLGVGGVVRVAVGVALAGGGVWLTAAKTLPSPGSSGKVGVGVNNNVASVGDAVSGRALVSPPGASVGAVLPPDAAPLSEKVWSKSSPRPPNGPCG